MAARRQCGIAPVPNGLIATRAWGAAAANRRGAMEKHRDKIDTSVAIAAFLTLALFLGLEGFFVAESLNRDPSAQAPPEWSNGLIRAAANPKYR
jgi:hypothetical protein